MNGEVELLFLERVQQGRWQFKTKPHTRFDKLMDAITYVSLFHLRTIYFTRGSVYAHVGKCYEISEDGMWFLRPHFTNYEEMAAKAGHASYRPFEEARTQEKVCEACGVDQFNDLIECSICHKHFCLVCLHLHTYAHVRQESEERQRQEQARAHYRFEDFFEDIHINWDPAKDKDTWGSFGRQSTAGTPPNQMRYISKKARDAFDLLGLAYTADAAQIKKAWKEKAKVTHPDAGGDHKSMVTLNEAKEIALKYAGE